MITTLPIFSLRSKFGPGRFSERKSKFQQKIRLFLTTGGFNKNIKSKRKFWAQHRRNIIRHFDILPNVLLTTSEMKHDF